MQLTLFDAPAKPARARRTDPVTRKASAGEQLRDAGIQTAVKNAESVSPGWQEQALSFVRSYPECEFMTEDVRQYAYDRGFQRPPHERAWGAVMVAAKKLGLVSFSRFGLVSNAKAHRTPATVWKKQG